MKGWKFGVSYKYFFVICMLIVLILFTSSHCLADDAMVLPKDRWMINQVFNYYPSWDKQFNDQGEAERLAQDYNRIIDDKVIGFLPSGTNVGRSIVDFEKKASIFNILVSHAFTDKLTVGIKIPYWTFKNKVKTSLDNTSANIVKNPDPNSPLGPFLPITMVDPNYSIPNYSNPVVEALKLTREEIISLLSGGLDLNGDSTAEIAGYGYERFETWSEKGIGDIELGLKYKYLENEKWRLALQAGSTLPTGREDDPDNLVDYGFGSGTYGFVLGFQNDFIGIKDFVLNGSVRYTNMLSNKETLRVPVDPDYPITDPDSKERVDRDLGDILELEFSAGYKFLNGFGLSATYGGFFKGKDSVKGEDGEHLKGLEGQTSQTGHTLLVGISYNNLDQFKNKLASVPFQVSLGHWHRFAGKNLNKAQYISFKGVLFF